MYTMRTPLAAGIDIGGTNIVYGWIDREGNILSRGSVLTNDYPDVLQMVEAVVAFLHEDLSFIDGDFDIAGIGIGAPNGNFYKGTIEFAPNLPWKGTIYLADLFSNAMGVPAHLTNDANAAAMGEMIFGAARGMKDFIMITLGTGLGSGIVIGGQMVYGHDGFAGELGHTIVDPEGRLCGCGRKGCLETYASASGIVRTVKEMLGKEHPKSLLDDIDQRDITAKKIHEAALNNDRLALQAFDYTSRILGMKLADAVAFSSPEAIILFGGLANAGELLFLPVKKYMEDFMLNIFKNKVRVLPSQLKDDDAALLGAASLVWKEHA